ncbi:hypothetical protein HNQ91_002155 [Filimonas zeae]|nr:hypothetical protein [Filimonas zeae]
MVNKIITNVEYNNIHIICKNKSSLAQKQLQEYNNLDNIYLHFSQPRSPPFLNEYVPLKKRKRPLSLYF